MCDDRNLLEIENNLSEDQIDFISQVQVSENEQRDVHNNTSYRQIKNCYNILPSLVGKTFWWANLKNNPEKVTVINKKNKFFLVNDEEKETPIRSASNLNERCLQYDENCLNVDINEKIEKKAKGFFTATGKKISRADALIKKRYQKKRKTSTINHNSQTKNRCITLLSSLVGKKFWWVNDDGHPEKIEVVKSEEGYYFLQNNKGMQTQLFKCRELKDRCLKYANDNDVELDKEVVKEETGTLQGSYRIKNKNGFLEETVYKHITLSKKRYRHATQEESSSPSQNHATLFYSSSNSSRTQTVNELNTDELNLQTTNEGSDLNVENYFTELLNNSNDDDLNNLLNNVLF